MHKGRTLQWFIWGIALWLITACQQKPATVVLTGTGGQHSSAGNTDVTSNLARDSQVSQPPSASASSRYTWSTGPRSVVDSGSGSAICGNRTCSAHQLCVHPCCGGTAPRCTPRPQSGVCPVGTDAVPTCIGSPGAGCRERTCASTPPYCIDRPAACAKHPDCACLPGVCAMGACGLVAGGDVHCLCA